ncbi:VAC8-like protein [Mya arenaria]|uniref:Vacuolar protein 8 n=1 Tax=Mya arenaria TaxID=6604 RepID=A0ABY7F151_MYAAR|nr:VAC8-like protein [Mya arenaria]
MESFKEQKLSTSMMEQFEIKVERPKPDPLEDIIDFLKRLLECCLSCLTCGCYHGNGSSRRSSVFNSDLELTSELRDSERQAVQNLLLYLEDEETVNPVLDENHVRALGILTYSDNLELQKSAALCYREISEKMKVPISPALAGPLVSLLKSSNMEVQKSASLAISNFVINGPATNRVTLVDTGALKHIIPLLYKTAKRQVSTENGIPPLLILLRSPDLRVQRNAAGAVLNLTHIDGAIPILIEVLERTDDHDLQYYCCAALNNLAIGEKHRTMMVAVGYHDVIQLMIRLLGTKSERVKCQACFVLRNLASDVDHQSLIVKYKALPALHRSIRHSRRETRAAAMACIRNLSIHKANEAPILSGEILGDILHVLGDTSVPEAQRHAAGTIRNLSVGDHVRELTDAGCVDQLTAVLLNIETKSSVLIEVTAALAVMADEDEVKHRLVHLHEGRVFGKLVTMATLYTNTEVQYNSAGILGQLALIAIPEPLKSEHLQGILLYVDKFLKLENSNFKHIALWTLVQLLKDPMFLGAFKDHGIEAVVTKLTGLDQQSTIQELANKVLHRLHGGQESSTASSRYFVSCLSYLLGDLIW